MAAQALVAAVRTVGQDHPVHSLHAYFLRPGDTKVPIIYEVDRIRDGRSFLTRRVVAIQNGEAIFNMSASFHQVEAGLSHQLPMPSVAPPNTVPPYEEVVRAILTETEDPVLRAFERVEVPIVMHDLDLNDPRSSEAKTGPHHVWIRSRGALPDDLLLHQCVLTYASDFMLVDASLRVHGRNWFERSLMVASLDHAMWFHRPFRADDWILYQMESPSTENARGLNTGAFFQDGQRIASVAQESLMREMTQRPDKKPTDT